MTLHIHRPLSQYTVPSSEHHYEEFLANLGPESWIKNRLEILHRLLLLNTYLASIATAFQLPVEGMTFKELRKAWQPPSSLFARAWSSNSREQSTTTNTNNRSLPRLAMPRWRDDMGEQQLLRTMTAITTLHTHPFMQAPQIWQTRMTAIKRRLLSHDDDASQNSSSSGVFAHRAWVNCGCANCVYVFARLNLQRALSHVQSLQSLREGESNEEEIGKQKRIVFKKSHPDYVDINILRASIAQLDPDDALVDTLLEQLDLAPEYFEAK